MDDLQRLVICTPTYAIGVLPKVRRDLGAGENHTVMSLSSISLQVESAGSKQYKDPPKAGFFEWTVPAKNLPFLSQAPGHPVSFSTHAPKGPSAIPSLNRVWGAWSAGRGCARYFTVGFLSTSYSISPKPFFAAQASWRAGDSEQAETSGAIRTAN